MPTTSLYSHFPPRLSMADYVRWLDQPLLRPMPQQASRQKALEERIEVPFRIPNLRENE